MRDQRNGKRGCYLTLCDSRESRSGVKLWLFLWKEFLWICKGRLGVNFQGTIPTNIFLRISCLEGKFGCKTWAKFLLIWGGFCPGFCLKKANLLRVCFKSPCVTLVSSALRLPPSPLTYKCSIISVQIPHFKTGLTWFFTAIEWNGNHILLTGFASASGKLWRTITRVRRGTCASILTTTGAHSWNNMFWGIQIHKDNV